MKRHAIICLISAGLVAGAAAEMRQRELDQFIKVLRDRADWIGA